jgi:formylglycine-generating enzyme required for sulfatase activity
MGQNERVFTWYFAALAGCFLAIVRMSATALAVEWVPVGNPGNAPDRIGGSVGYSYQMGKYELTNSQYVQFLNAVDPSGANALALYSTHMTVDSQGGINFKPGAVAGSKYEVKGGWASKPVVYVSFYDAVRLANWLGNGQPTGGGTETGSYTLIGNTPVPSNGTGIVRNANATVVLPSADEWHKAAYYDPAKGPGGGYWSYPTRSLTQPYSDQPPGTGSPDPSNVANFLYDDGLSNGYDDGFAATGVNRLDTSSVYLTDVGAYAQSASAYGTFDQGGNVGEWLDTPGEFRFVQGGSWVQAAGEMEHSEGAFGYSATAESDYIGIRLIQLPEPSAVAPLVMVPAALFARRRRARR